jgi:hypothetical protein
MVLGCLCAERGTEDAHLQRTRECNCEWPGMISLGDIAPFPVLQIVAESSTQGVSGLG